MSVRSNSIVTLDTRIQGARSLILLPFFNAFAILLLFRVFFFKFFYNDVHGSLHSCNATRIRNLVVGFKLYIVHNKLSSIICY